jgi:site-specific DNA recombinase
MNERIGIYARVSTEMQAEEGYSIDAQCRAVREMAKSAGDFIVDEYVDRGISGKAMNNRPELQRLLEDVKAKKLDKVIVWKTNRLARNHFDLLKMTEMFEKYDVSFKSITEPFETSTAVGKLLMNMLASVGEFERETIVDNVKLGMKERAKKGKWNGGRVLGYRSIKDSNGETKLEIEESEAEIVRKIFNLYSEGNGLKAIANKLNHMEYKTRRGNAFGVTAIRDIIRNPIYIGIIRFNKYVNWSTMKKKGNANDLISVEGEHDAIIDVELWERVQEIKRKKSKKPKRTFDGSYPLTGLLKCPQCGASMVAARTSNILADGTKKVIRYYYCGTFKNKGSKVCKSNSIRADYAEEYVFNRIREVVLNEDILKDIVDNLNESRKKNIRPLERELELMSKELKKLSDKKGKVFELYEESMISKENLMSRLNEIDEMINSKLVRKKVIDSELKQNTSDKIPFKAVKKIMNDFNNMLIEAPKDKQKVLLQMLIAKITIKDRKKIDTIEIQFNKEMQRFVSQEKGESSENEDSPSFLFKIAI